MRGEVVRPTRRNIGPMEELTDRTGMESGEVGGRERN
jgi:hypothetical protein